MGEVLNQNQNERFSEILRIKALYKQEKPTWNGANTKAFQKFNMSMLDKKQTDTIAFSGNKIYNRNTGRLINRSTIFTQKDTIRNRYDNDNMVHKNDTFLDIQQYLKPLATKINRAEQQATNVKIDINFDKVNNNLSKFISILNPTSKKYLLHNKTTGSFSTLSSSVLNRIASKLLNGGMNITTTGVGSDIDIIASWDEGDDWELQIINEDSGSAGMIIDGAFFPFLNQLTDLNLDRYGVHHVVDDKNYEDNCLIHSLETAGYDTTAIKCLCKNQEIPMRHLKTIAKTLNIYLSVRRLDDEKKKTHYGDSTQPEIQLGLIEKHYFLIEDIPYTQFSIKNYQLLHDNQVADWNKVFAIETNKKTGNKKYKRKDNRWTDSYTIIKYLVHNADTCLEPIKHTEKLYATNKYKQVKEFGSLEYNDKIFDWKDEEPEGNLMENKPIGTGMTHVLDTIFFDFETTTARNDETEVVHKPYCVFTDKNKLGWWGRDCGRKMLNDFIERYGVSKDQTFTKPRVNSKGEPILDKETGEQKIDSKNLWDETIEFKRCIRLIAHNSSYDFRFLLKYLTRIETIEKGTGLMNANSLYFHNDKVVCINIRDSLKMINMPLRKFGECFALSVEKEIMPYDLYSEENIKTNWLPIDYCLSFVKPSDKKQYMFNCERWNCITDGKINILKYSGEYCYMDCITLRDGYECFRGLVKTAIDLDICDYMTLPSMANDYLVRAGCYEGVLKLSGVPRHFIQNCVVGGRTMCKRNEKQHITDQPLADFDAVSLYPSAMARMKGFLMGKPKVITDFESIKNTADGYYVCVEITKVGKHYDFPCASLHTAEGIRNFTNDLVGQKVYMDKIALDDLVKFQDAEFRVINGYYFDEGFQNQIVETIQYVFEQRLKYKKDGNPLQMVFKELMNSSYGKTCLKPIDTNVDYIAKADWDKFVVRNYNYIQEATLLANGLYFKVKTIKTIDTHFNNVHIGVSILSTSKTIMYEVMTLAEDLDIDMYYTDTDSIHIDNSKIEYLGQEFQKKYGRELIGKQMGQFHTDFDLEDSVGDIVASETIILGKKCYIDKLSGKDKDGAQLIDYHIRMKGVSTNCIKFKGNQEYNGDFMKMFKELYDGKTLEFNLLAVAPSFELCKNMNVKSRKKFTRRITYKNSLEE